MFRSGSFFLKNRTCWSFKDLLVTERCLDFFYSHTTSSYMLLHGTASNYIFNLPWYARITQFIVSGSIYSYLLCRRREEKNHLVWAGIKPRSSCFNNPHATTLTTRPCLLGQAKPRRYITITLTLLLHWHYYCIDGSRFCRDPRSRSCVRRPWSDRWRRFQASTRCRRRCRRSPTTTTSTSTTTINFLTKTGRSGNGRTLITCRPRRSWCEGSSRTESPHRLELLPDWNRGVDAVNWVTLKH